MKQAYLHVFYLTIIAFLGYNYWSSVQAFKAFGHLNKQLNADYGVLDNAARLTHRDIQKNRDAYPNAASNHQADMAQKIVNKADTLIDFLNTHKVEFIQLNGGFITSNKNDSINNPHSTKGSQSFFTDAKINEIQAKLLTFTAVLTDSINDDGDKLQIYPHLNVPKLVNNSAYWNLLKTLPASAILAELAFIKNQIKVDEIFVLNYHFSKVTICGIIFDVYKTAIAPKKAALIEGETFEADVYLSAYSSTPQRNLSIQVNGDLLEINRGVAHFKGKKEAVGTKTFKAVATIKNPLTGQVTTSEGSFEYQVLPKCSRDCQ
jgi:hypothetical protein